MVTPILPIRVAQAVLSVIILGLTAYAASWYNGHTDLNLSPNELNFMIFCSVWTWLALVYLMVVPQFLPSLHNRYAVLACEAVTTIFWFSSWIALAVFVGDFVGACRLNPCGAMKAAVALGAFEWLLWCFSLALVVRSVMAYRSEKVHGPTHHEDAAANPSGLPA